MKIIVLLFLIILLAFSSAVYSQVGEGGVRGRIEGDFKFIPIPYLNYNRSIEFTFGALPLAMFNPVGKDTLSPSSLAGLLGIYSTNKTWFFMGFTKIYLDQDNWRITAAGGLGSINFQFYIANPINIWIPYNTSIDFGFVQGERRIYDKLYLGISYIYLKFKTKTNLPTDGRVDIQKGFGLKVSLDKRDNVYYPINGIHTSIKYFAYPEGMGNDRSSNKIQIEYNHYFPFREEKDVLVARMYLGLGIGDLSFNQQFIVGQKDIRGYTQGEFRGNYLAALQGEYRWNFSGRWGIVGFLGFATLFEAINEEDDGRILPGIGTGIRFTAFEDNNMNVGLDIAGGYKDWGIYFRIGEAF
jgi:outer membrane protein assembly factor BamA